MDETLLTKKDIVAFNQQIEETGDFNNESSLDFALSIARNSINNPLLIMRLIRHVIKKED